MVLTRDLSTLAAVVIVGAAFRFLAADSALLADEGLPRGMIEKVHRDAAGEHRYVVFIPHDYTPLRKWPVILFLHGAGERGTDGRLPTTVGLGPYVEQRADSFPFIVVFPQSEDVHGRSLTGWSADSPDGRRALAILDEVEREFSIDRDHEVLTGWSMGGYGVWSIAAATPERWSAVVPIAGGGDRLQASLLQDVPVWAIHGAEDRAVPPGESRRMIEAVRAAGGRPHFTEVPNVGHDVWRAAYAEDAVFNWMLHPERSAPADEEFAINPEASLPSEADETFVPAVVVPEAVYVRLGNDVLDALAESIPVVVPADLLHGQIGNHAQYTSAEGVTFRVDMTGIHYDGRITRAAVQAHANDRLRVRLGLEHATITIGATFLRGRFHSATAGPMRIVLGHRRPVWLSFDVRPVIADHRLRLELLDTEFDIPRDNWYVTTPSGVSTRGFGMTRARVSRGLVRGLYGSKSRIESDVKALVPSLVADLEGHLEPSGLAGLNELVNGIWPIPVLQPRLRLRPEQVATDDSGVSLVFGVAAEAIDSERASDAPIVVPPVGISANEVPRMTSLQVGIAPNTLNALSTLLVESGQARVHLLDIPDPAFGQLANVNALSVAIPDLERFGDDVDLRAELILDGPITVVDAPPRDGVVSSADLGNALAIFEHESGANNVNSESVAIVPGDSGDGPGESIIQLQAPRLLISYALRTDANPEWTPYTEFELNLAQAVQATLSRPNYEERALRLEWSGEPEITGQGLFDPEYSPKVSELDAALISRMFGRAWVSWMHSGPMSDVRIPDIEFGTSKLRVAEVGWSSPYLFATFIAPAVRISNESDEDLVYETRGPHSAWGGPYTLAPGEFHDFEVTYPILYRHETESETELYTLPTGSHSEFRTPRRGGSPRLFKARERQ